MTHVRRKFRTSFGLLGLATLLTVGCGGVDDAGLGEDDQGQGEEEFELAIDSSESGLCSPVDPARELMIRDLAVVNDPVRTRWTGATTSASDGAWHFGRLMANMAGAQDPSDFVLAFLRTWTVNRTVNGLTVPARPAIGPQLINIWPRLANGKLDLTRPPLRLLAIVNRMDLRNLAAGHAGEGRFVFGVLDAAGAPTQFTIILEYRLPASTPADVTAWANRWHDLSLHARGSAAYRTALQAVTDRFARRNAEPARINGSAINQVRTNEIALAFPWELREFRLSAATLRLVEVTVAQTPANEFNGTARLRDFINQNQTAIEANRYTVPLQFQNAPFRAGAIRNEIDFWRATGIASNRARHIVSLNTCNGCHGRETDTIFTHVQPRAANQVAGLSGFLTGITVIDPVNPAVSRRFNDLARRSRDLTSLICATTSGTVQTQSVESASSELGARVH